MNFKVPKGWMEVKTGLTQKGDKVLVPFVGYEKLRICEHGKPVESFYGVIRQCTK